jgi:hypothetical protein
MHTTEGTTSSRCQVQLASEKVPHAHNSQTVRRTSNGIYDIFIIQFILSVGKMFQDLLHSENAKSQRYSRRLEP